MDLKKVFCCGSVLLLIWGVFLQYGECLAKDKNKKGEVIKSWFEDDIMKENLVKFGGRSSISVVKDSDEKRGRVIQIKLDDLAYSGVEVMSYTEKFNKQQSIDLSKLKKTAALSFYIKGKKGKERLYLTLADTGDKDGNKVSVACRSKNYFDMTTEWQKVNIPLSGFRDEGERFYQEEEVIEYAHIDWTSIGSVMFKANKEQNMGPSEDRIAEIYVDDLCIVNNPKKINKQRRVPWGMQEVDVSGPKQYEYDEENTVFRFLGRKIGPYTCLYTYQELTDYSIPESQSDSSLAVLAGYFDDLEWSGITLYRSPSHSLNVSPYLNTGGLEFMVKGKYGGEEFTIGILDDESDGVDRKVQSRLKSKLFLEVTSEWQRVRVPFSDFSDIGKWWNTNGHYEAVGRMDWQNIAEVRFSTARGGNIDLTDKGEKPAVLYFSDIKLVRNMEVFTNKQYWDVFESDAPDKTINTFEEQRNIKNWEPSISEGSEMKISAGENNNDHSQAVRMDYKVGVGGSMIYEIPKQDSSQKDWSDYSGMKFDFYSSEIEQTSTVMIVDSTNEAWYASFGAEEGWNDIVVPFKDFRLYEWWQPDNVEINRKMDMRRINSYDFRPGIIAKRGVLKLDNIQLTNDSKRNEFSINAIRYNQAGYLPDQSKRIVVADSAAQSFAVFDSDDNYMFSNKLRSKGYWDLSGEYIKHGEFTGVTSAGKYRIVIDHSGDEQEVNVRNRDYRREADKALKSLYIQRIAVPLKKEYAGEWHREGVIQDTACILHSSTGKKGKLDVSGGWMDAGDYGKYVVNAGITIGTMLGLYELFPDCFSDSIGIPESGNGVNDLLDEVKYELDWLQKMQDKDGGVFFKVASIGKWDGFVTPSELDAERYVIGKTTASTLNFAAVMGMAGRIYKDIDAEFSKNCIKKAERAWTWALSNPDIAEPMESSASGAYTDNEYSDEFFWAACELYTTTYKEKYKSYIKSNTKKNEITTVAGWNSVENLGWYTLAVNFPGPDFSPAVDARMQIRTDAERVFNFMDSSFYRVPTNNFIWGSNSLQINRVISSCYAYHFAGKPQKRIRYLGSVIDAVDYIFGKNAVGYSFVTGVGDKSPKQPHHRAMASDGVNAPYPGFLIGGPNGDRQDEVDSEPNVYYPHKEPAKCYIDRISAYACNEVAINWNSPLVFVLEFLNKSLAESR